jgi:hypothetical protein
MSVSYSIACLDCGVFAPEVGASGYIGSPTLDLSQGQPPNFGYLYEAFAGIQLITWDLELLREFLERHVSHRTHVFADGEPLFGNGSGAPRPPDPGDTRCIPSGFGKRYGAKLSRQLIRWPVSASVRTLRH